MKIYFIDTETGGLDPQKTDLLTVGIVEWENETILRTMEIKIVRDVYRLTPKALEVNKIDLSHFNTNIPGYYTPYGAKKEIVKFVSGPSQEKKIIAGHNIAFDIGFINEQLFKANHDSMNDCFDYRAIDTASILRTLYIAKKLPEDLSKLDDALSYFGVYIEEKERHTALGDAIATAKLFNKLLETIKK